MTSTPHLGPGGLDPTRRSDTSGAAGEARAKKDAQEAAGPAFHALLEELQMKAAELERTSQGADDADLLAGAVDTARSSLEDALSLSDQLLEAYREARQQTPETTPSEDDQ